MKKISRRSFLAVCGTLAAATALTACGGSSSSTASSAAAGSSEAASVEVQDVALKVWGPQEDQVDSSSWLPTMCEQFNDAHPEWNITFTYEVCSEGDASKNVTQDVSAAADVYMFANDQLGTLVQANAIAQLGGSYLDEVLNDNPDTMIDSVTSTDGGVYGVPFTGNTWFMYYDTSVFSEDDVKSLDTMLEKGKVAFPLTDSWYIASFYYANGCTIFGESGMDADAGFDFGGDKAVAVTKYLVNLYNNANFSVDADGSGLSGLREGTVNAIFSGTWNAEPVKEALGDKAGLVRYGSCLLPMDETLALCAVDLGGRPYFVYDASFAGQSCGGMDVQMAREFFYAISYAAMMNLHLKVLYGENDHHKLEAMFKAFAKALDAATRKDARIDGVLSTKGTL